jgi:hypothetical protein
LSIIDYQWNSYGVNRKEAKSAKKEKRAKNVFYQKQSTETLRILEKALQTPSLSLSLSLSFSLFLTQLSLRSLRLCG